MSWPAAARDHNTFCVSCHTALPYALARPALHAMLGEITLSPVEDKLVDNVKKRVRLWNEIGPYYTNSNGPYKTAESRGTEAVLNALVLANYDAPTGKLSPEARAAFGSMWADQHRSGNERGAWSWLQFNNMPWEGQDSQYYGAALAAVAVGMAPDSYRAELEVQGHLTLLREYLTREFRRQSPINHVVLLWAAAKWRSLLSSEHRSAIFEEVEGSQRADGGWSLSSLAWTWRDWTLISVTKMLRSEGLSQGSRSDGYATGLIALVLKQVGVPGENVQLKRATSWLVNNQDKSGRWLGYSLNTRHHASSKTGLFMTDAATAYAVLALAQGR